METLEGLVKAHIRTHGPMDIATYMGMALGHPRLGYYITRDPLGAAGDFTTAPEISQLFGEMIGLCLADAWLRAGGPTFHMAELGPGRGTLMADLLRATRHVPHFHERMDLHLVETSPALRAKQKDVLTGHEPRWHDTVETLPADAPLLIVANEFFDALPIRQAVMTAVGWQERVVGLDGAENLIFGTRALPLPLGPAPLGSIHEFSPVREHVTQALCARLAAQGGVLLAIDYGHDTSRPLGDTLQAVYRHAPCHPLSHTGNADLTSHVDFAAMAHIARASGCRVQGSVTQKAFLETLGIGARLSALKAPQLDSGVQRLTDGKGMGGLFRAMAIGSSAFSCAGFDSLSGT